jgi:biotin transport system substrate-specific component
MGMNMKTKTLVYIAVSAAILCVFSPWSIPIGLVPLSLATFAVYLIGAVSGHKKGSISILIFLLIGAVGVPVFSNFQGGLPKLIGPTGGYLIGYLPCGFISGLLVDKLNGRKWAYPLGMLLGTIILYLMGTAWFVYVTDYTFVAALAVCVLPFLIGDAIKILVASLTAIAVRPVIKKYTSL